MKLLYIDLFCGAGGTSTGVENARYEGRQCAKVIGCVNHDANAIASHAANHPDALHFTEDIRTLELSPLTAHIAEMRRQYSDAFVVLWASLECTNFSKAKGGQPRDADSRTLAEHLFRYIEAINPDYIQIENVEEFMSWGDLDENGKPISKDAGRLYQQWVSNVCGYGYRFAHRILNSADYGAYTTRRRFFGIFAKGSLPIVFPEPTHSKDGATALFGQMQRWKPVREVLDFSDEGRSIFGRKKPLVDATLERIYAGLIKFVAGGKEAFLVKWNSMSSTGKYHAPSIDEPCPTVATQNRLGIAQVNFLSKHYGGSPAGKCVSVEEPAGTITTWDHHSFITAYYGNGHNHSIDAPAPTLTTRDRLAFVDMRDKFYYAMWNWIRRYWRNIGKAKDIAPQTAAAYERALDKQVEEVADLKYRLSSLTQWRDIQADPKWGFATDDAIDEIFRNLPRLVKDKRDGCIELIDYDNAAEWRGDLERKPSLYQWLPINGNTL